MNPPRALRASLLFQLFETRLTCRATLMLVVALLAFTPLLHGQFRGSIQGVVTDSHGGVIPGATLTLVDNSTNEKRVSVSNGVGVYNFNALPPSHFTLIVKKPGFETKILNNLQIIPEQSNALNVQLSVGSVSQSVRVDASREPLIDTQSGSIGGVISSNQIQHMPSFGRDVFQLIQLAPGTEGDASQSAGGGTFSLPSVGGQPGGPGANTGIFATENGPQTLANGSQYENNGITIDGISTASAVWGGTTVVTPTEESVGNVKVVANSYDAESGRFSGAQIQVTSKSGTNQFHGSAFFQAYRPGLNAYQRYNGTGFYNSGTPAERGLLKDTQQFNQFGGSIGGPIWKDKIFAFFAYEAERNNSQVTGTGWYETPTFDKLAPSGSIASQFLSVPGAGVHAKGMINQSCSNIGLVEGKNCITIPGQGLNIGSPLASGLGRQDPTWTSPFSPGVGSGLDSSVADIAEYTTLNPTSVIDAQYNGRLDANITSKDHASFAIYWVPVDQTYYQGPVRTYNLWHHSAINDAFSGIWNHTFSPTFLNEARANAAGWRWNEISSNPQEPFGLPEDTVSQIGDLDASSPEKTFNYFGAPGPTVFDQWTYSYKDVATKIIGRHTIKFGGEVTRLYYLNEAPYAARPTFAFFNVWDFLNDAPKSESGTFDPLTGIPTAGRQDDREDLWGAFVQDDWKVRPNLTINLGMRYSYFGPLSSKEGDMYGVVMGQGSNLLTGISIRAGGNLWQAQKGNFGPQIGFAWSPKQSSGRFVVRGGFGLNYNQEEIAISASVFSNPGLTVSPNFTMNLPSSPNPGIVYQVPSDIHSLYGYPPNPNTIVSFNSNGLPSSGQVGVTAFDASLPTMYTEHYSLETEYNLGHQFVASLGYQGSVSSHTFFHYEGNAAASAKGIPLNPQINSVNYFGNGGHANYNSMIAGLKHQFSQHFMADAQFTWAKSMDTSSDPYVEQDYPYNPGLSYGRSDYNIGRAFKLYGMWQPVIFHGTHRWLEKLAGGWSISGILNLHTGFPWSPVFDVTGGSLYCSTCNYTQLLPASYLGGAGHDTSNDAYKSGPGVGSGVNKNFPLAATAPNQAEVYFAPPGYTPGPQFPATGGSLPQTPGVKRNSWTGPGYRDVDATLSKSFGLPYVPGLGENAKFEFRADAFNLFNNLNFNPGSISNNIQAPNFGQAQSALGSRMITLQARFSF